MSQCGVVRCLVEIILKGTNVGSFGTFSSCLLWHNIIYGIKMCVNDIMWRPCERASAWVHMYWIGVHQSVR